MDNIEIREFQQAIVNFINKSDLPAEVKRLSLLEIMEKLTSVTDAEIMAEIQERDRKEGKEDGKQQSIQQDKLEELPSGRDTSQ